MRVVINSFDLSDYGIALCSIQTNVDPRRRDEGSMVVRVEGKITGDYFKRRIRLIDAVVPSAGNGHVPLLIRLASMEEDATAIVVPRLQSIPMRRPASDFVLVWESEVPYLIGTLTGIHYPQENS